MSATLIHGKTSGGGTHLPVKVEAYGDGTGVLLTQPISTVDTTAGSAGFSVTVAAAATDVVVIQPDSTTMYVRRIIISGTATAAAAFTVLLKNRTTDNTGGTAATFTAIKYDGTGAFSDTQGGYYTANPAALGTDAGTVAQKFLQVSSAALGVAPAPLVFDFSETPFKCTANPISYLALNLNGATIAGLVLNVTVEIERFDV